MADAPAREPLHTLLLSLADDEFILGYRNSEWTGIAPLLEEDVAFSSMAQDEIGHARILYQMLAGLTGDSPDRLAYGRRPEEYLSCQLMERPRGDWAYSVARQSLYDMADHVRLGALVHSSYEPLARAAQKIVREEKYHLMHGDMWLDRLANRSPVSKEKLDAALVALWPDLLGIFEELPGEALLIEGGVLPEGMSSLQAEWLAQLAPVLQKLDLPFPAEKNGDTGLYAPTVEGQYGGREGRHTPEFSTLWEEMTSVYKLDPQAVW